MAWFRAETAGGPHLFGAESGPNRVVLRGRIVTLNNRAQVVEDGFVAVEGTRIVAVGPAAQPLPDAFATVTQIDTHGTIYPDLIKLHNHPSYNAIPLWQAPRAFANRKAWRNDPEYRRRVSTPAIRTSALLQPPSAM